MPYNMNFGRVKRTIGWMRTICAWIQHMRGSDTKIESLTFIHFLVYWVHVVAVIIYCSVRCGDMRVCACGLRSSTSIHHSFELNIVGLKTPAIFLSLPYSLYIYIYMNEVRVLNSILILRETLPLLIILIFAFVENKYSHSHKQNTRMLTQFVLCYASNIPLEFIHQFKWI